MAVKRFLPCLLAVAWLLLGGGSARAQDNMLRGPHPFLKDNELDAYVLLASGMADTPSGTKLAINYGYKVALPLWLDLQLNLQLSGCHSTPGGMTCGPDNGKVFETLAGVAWKWALPIPVVPFARAVGGLVFVFPDTANGAVGVAIRGAAGASYFFFDWLGLGVEVGVSLGRVGYDSTFPGSHSYGVLDFGGGIQLQF